MLMRLNKRRGFSLVEIVIVLGIMLLLASLALYSLLRVRIDSNNGAGISGLKAIVAALEAYKVSNGTYTGVLNDLISDSPPYLSEGFSDRENQGYNFYIPFADGNRYMAYGQPVNYGVTGSKFIIYDQSGLKIYDSYESAVVYFFENYSGGMPDRPPGYGGGGGGGGEGCFLSDTPILMSDGSFKPIQDVKVGDKIIAFDEETGEFKEDKVVKFFQHKADEYLIVNDKLKVTKNHPVYSDGNWVEIGSLKEGDNLLSSKGEPERIASIKEIKETVLVYNLEVNPYHTFIAGGIVAHNKTREEQPPCEEGEGCVPPW
jgi:prepilin-type N-terminal cleavage/methylation domain-containing protein